MSEENLYTFENPEYRKTYWHSCSHIMAQAVKRLWPEVKLAIGPAIDEGWYYDFDAPFAFTPEHLTQIEGEMKKICKERLSIVRSEKPREEAIAYMREQDEPYKVELIEDLPADAVGLNIQCLDALFQQHGNMMKFTHSPIASRDASSFSGVRFSDSKAANSLASQISAWPARPTIMTSRSMPA